MLTMGLISGNSGNLSDTHSRARCRLSILAFVWISALAILQCFANTAQTDVGAHFNTRFELNPMYGVTSIRREDAQTIGDASPSFDNRTPRLYLVKFVDSVSQEHTIIDSMDLMTEFSLCDSNTLALLSHNGGCWHLYTKCLTDLLHADTLISSCNPGDSGRWLMAGAFQFRTQDSLLAFAGTMFDFKAEHYMTPATVVLQVSHSAVYDTLAVMMGATQPRFSLDGKELFLGEWDMEAPLEDCVVRAVIFDVETKSQWYPFSASDSVIRVYRPSKELPLFYEKTDSQGNSSIWRSSQFGDDEQITGFSQKLLHGWIVAGDSLVCLVRDSLGDPPVRVVIRDIY